MLKKKTKRMLIFFCIDKTQLLFQFFFFFFLIRHFRKCWTLSWIAMPQFVILNTAALENTTKSIGHIKISDCWGSIEVINWLRHMMVFKPFPWKWFEGQRDVKFPRQLCLLLASVQKHMLMLLEIPEKCMLTTKEVLSRWI